jgi:hypothetical protein
MTLNKKNWIAMYYNWIHGNYPKDVCTFFWGSLIAIILSPIISMGRILLNNDFGRNIVFLQAMIGSISSILLMIVCALGNTIMEKMMGYEFIYMWTKIIGGFFVGLFSLIIIGGMMAGIFFGIGWMRGKVQEIKYNKWQEENIKVSSGRPRKPTFMENTKSLIGAIRGKYCTKITWE